MLRAASSAFRARLSWRAPSYTMCSYTSSLNITMSVLRVSAVNRWRSSDESTLAPGLFGVLTTIIRVRGVIAAASACQSIE